MFVLLQFHDTLHLGLLQEAVIGVKRKHDCSAAGQPEFAIDVDNVKPTGLVVGAALIMLVLGKPLTGSRAFGGAVFSLPQMGDCKAMAGLYHMSICYHPGAPRWCAGCAALSRIAVEQLFDASCFLQAWSSSATRRCLVPFLHQVTWYKTQPSGCRRLDAVRACRWKRRRWQSGRARA